MIPPKHLMMTCTCWPVLLYSYDMSLTVSWLLGRSPTTNVSTVGPCLSDPKTSPESLPCTVDETHRLPESVALTSLHPLPEENSPSAPWIPWIFLSIPPRCRKHKLHTHAYDTQKL